jgi:hypothetical protein
MIGVNSFVQIPGTWEIRDPGVPVRFEGDFSHLPIARMEGVKDLWLGSLGECSIIAAREQAGENGEWLYHLSIAHPDRHTTWDEIKAVRYRLLPLDLVFGVLLPPPEFYVNVEAQDHTFHLWEVNDLRRPWAAQ